MKIRNGFVSNSSSSSFVLGIRGNEPCPHCGRRSLDVVGLIERGSSNGETSLVASDYDEVVAYIKEDGFIVDELDKITKYHQKHPDAQIVYAWISYHDETLNELINNSGDIDIIVGSDG